jgi:tetratricopeptide (TPR) repeat protein
LACVLWLSTGPARAQSTSDDLARRHFDSGVAYLEESDYESALKAFQKSYDLSKRPEILLNIATVHERQSDLPAAVAALRGYLEAAPTGEHVETVKLRIQNLEKRIQEQQQASKPEPAPLPPPAPVAPAPAAAPAKPLEPAPRAEPNRVPAYVTLGIGGALGAGALVTGLLAKSKYDDAEKACAPSCSPAEVSSSRTLAITSTVLTGAALLGVGLGVALYLTADGDAAPVGKAPRFDVALGPSAAAASAAWSF